MQSSIGKLSSIASSAGVPFAATLAVVNQRLDLSSAKTGNFAKSLSNLGAVSLVAAGAGLAIIGTQAVHAADQFEISRARLETAVKNTGQEFDAAAPRVSALDQAFVKLGFNTSDTENSLSRLTAATGNVNEALRLMSLSADIARARNIPLQQSTDLLAKASLGNFLGLRRLGIVSKEDIASFKNLGDVTAFLTNKFGGQAQAFTETFAGKMAALHATANQLEVTIGTALIPKIEALAQGTVSAIHGFEDFNRSTGGAAGKLALIVAATPAAFFAVSKLAAGFKALATAEGLAATAGTLAAGAVIGLVAGVAVGEKINQVLGGAKPSVDALAKSFQNLAKTHLEDANATSVLGGGARKLAGDLTTLQGNTLQKGFGFAPSAHRAVKDVSAANDALKQLIATAGPGQAQLAFGQLALRLKASGVSMAVISKEFGPFLQALGLAQSKGETAANAIKHAGGAADAGKFSYLGLADSVTKASDALTQISQHAFIKFDAQVAVNTDTTNVQSALDALNHPDTGSSGGGGGQTATAAALEQAQKVLSLRDAKRGETQATQAVKDAENALTQSRKDATTAAKAVTVAQENLRTTLNGVSRDSQTAKDAVNALAAAQNAAAGGQLDISAAQRAVTQAHLDAQSARLAVTDAQTQLSNDLADQADPEQIAKDTIALKNARLNAAGSADQVKRAELDLSNAQLQAKQNTKDLTEARRVENGVLHGYKPASDEAKAAQQQLTDAQAQAKAATDSVRQAQEALTTAQFQTKDSALALIRAQADLDGKLTASTGAASAGKKLDSLTTRANNAAVAIKQLAVDAAAADLLAGHSIGHSILVEIQTLKAYTDANPLLAGAFDQALSQLEAKFIASISAQAFKTGKSIVPGGPGHAVGVDSHSLPGFALGGVVPGPMGAPMVAVVHGGETVVPAMSLKSSRPMTGAFGGGDTYIINASTLEAHRIGAVVVKSLEQHNGGYLPSSIKTTS